MANQELFVNPYITPYFVAANNMIYLVNKITFNEIIKKLTIATNIAYEFIKIISLTIIFITTQLIKELSEYFHKYPITNEKIIFILFISSLITFIALDKTNKKIHEQREEINSLQKQIEFLNLAKEDSCEVLSDEIKCFINQTDYKFTELNKITKKIQKELRKFD